ncbi:hypothetical protein [Botrimarina mediterranea]|uniref:hypothetical protein n=1 Tax=Botrimarina mediterranea TaxID=2528022 RepID=UPI0011889B9B|nr:hypothetical protein K2D_16760 [Planctomycetes bacterium K2D]
MSIANLTNARRVIGDLSLVKPAGANGSYNTASGQYGVTLAATKFGIYFSANTGCRTPLTETAVSLTSAWLFGLSAGTNPTQNQIAFRMANGNSRGVEAFVKQSNVTIAGPTVNLPSGTIASSSISAYTVHAEDRFFLKCDGTAVTLYALYIDREGGQNGAYHLVKSAVTASATPNLNTIVGASGRWTLGLRGVDEAQTMANVAGVTWLELDSGTSWADVDLDTDAQVEAFLANPHGELNANFDSFEKVITFDACNSSAERKLDAATVVAGDKAVCPHTGLQATWTESTTPTDAAETRQAYAPLAVYGEQRNSVNASPDGVDVGSVRVHGELQYVGTGDVIQTLSVRDPATGYRLGPVVLLPMVWARHTTATGDLVATSDGYFFGGAPTTIGEVHTAIALAHDSTTGRIVACCTQHHDTQANQPLTGETLSQLGVLWDIRDGQLPIPHLIPSDIETTISGQAVAYGATFASGGVVYGVSRGASTTGTDATGRYWKIASDGTVTTRSLHDGPTITAAGYPVDYQLLGSTGLAAAVFAVRITDGGFWGPHVVLNRIADWDSEITGWYGARDGTNVADEFGTAKWHDPEFWPIAGDARDQFDAYAASSTALDPSALDEDIRPFTGTLIQHTENGVTFVGLLTSRTADPQRLLGNDYIETVAVKVDVFRLVEGSAPYLQPIRTVDLTPAVLRAAYGKSGVTPADLPLRDANYGFPVLIGAEGDELTVGCMRTDGVDFSDSWPAAAIQTGGVSLGYVKVGRWYAPDYTLDAVATVAQATDYNAAALTARKGPAGNCQLDLTLSGAPNSRGSSTSSVLSRYVSLTLPAALERDINTTTTFAS